MTIEAITVDRDGSDVVITFTGDGDPIRWVTDTIDGSAFAELLMIHCSPAPTPTAHTHEEWQTERKATA